MESRREKWMENGTDTQLMCTAHIEKRGKEKVRKEDRWESGRKGKLCEGKKSRISLT